MVVYRIAKSIDRLRDLSGFGSFKYGGRWNSKGTYMLYASINSSLAYLENLVHFNENEIPPNLYVAAIEIKNDGLIYQLPDSKYPAKWKMPENPGNKIMGDKWIRQNKYVAFKVRSAINPSEYNFLLNPAFPRYHDLVTIQMVESIEIDTRLLR